MDKKILVGVADDDAIIREGLKIMICSQPDMELAGIAENGIQAVELCREKHPDVILMDIRMPKLDGIKAAEKILEEKLAQPLLLTTFDEEDFILRALDIGVAGYILKNSPGDRIMNSIRAVHAGAAVFQQDILDCISGRIGSGPGSACFSSLSKRELEVAELIARGLSNQEIADRLFISNGTVRNHVSLILEKCGLKHRTQIAVKYLNKRAEGE